MSTSYLKIINELSKYIFNIYNNANANYYLGYDKQLKWKKINLNELDGFDKLNKNILFQNGLGIDTTEINDTLNIGLTNAGIINIGSSNETKTINIGTTNSNTTINIGDMNDVVNISGSLNVIKTNNVEVYNKYIILNGNSVGSGTARNSGIYIRDDNDNKKGYIQINNTGDGFELKAPESIGKIIIPKTNEDTIMITSNDQTIQNIKNNIEIDEENIYIKQNVVIQDKIIYLDSNKSCYKQVLTKITNDNMQNTIFKLLLENNSSYLVKFEIIAKNILNFSSGTFCGSLKIRQLENNNTTVSNTVLLETIIDQELEYINISSHIEDNIFNFDVIGLENEIIQWKGYFKIIFV